jgi:hypothetical protein
MNEQCYSDKSTKENLENFRVLIQIAYNRIDQLNNINLIVMGLVITIVIGIFTFFPNKSTTIVFGVLVLFLWRISARIIDGEIIEQYGEIIFCEEKLTIPEEFKLINKLIRRFSKPRKMEYDHLHQNEKFSEFSYLIKTKQVSHRFHDVLDFIAILGSCFLITFMLNNFNLDFFSQNIGEDIAILFLCFALWWILEKIIIIRNPPPVANLKLTSNDLLIENVQFGVYLIFHLVIAFVLLILFIYIIEIDTIIILSITKLPFNPFSPYIFGTLALFCVFGFGINFNNILIKTKSLVEKFPEHNSLKSHHAIIIAHKYPPNVKGVYDESDYTAGIEILIERFQKDQINYKVYEVSSKEELQPIIFNEKAEYLWIFGHGKRHKLRLFKGDVNYYDFKDAPKKKFIGQYHCNGLFWKSLADYNNPYNSDVTWWLRNTFSIRRSVRRMLKKLLSNDPENF